MFPLSQTNNSPSALGWGVRLAINVVGLTDTNKLLHEKSVAEVWMFLMGDDRPPDALNLFFDCAEVVIDDLHNSVAFLGRDQLGKGPALR